MTRLAFAIHFNKTWLGGVNVILNLINSVSSSKNFGSKINIVLFTNSKKKLSKFKLDKKVEIIECEELFNIGLMSKLIDKISIVLFGKTIFLEKFLKKYNIDFISHTQLVTGKRSSIKSIIWIPDFQYLHFPDFFSFTYKFLKKINILIYKHHAFKILLSSNSALKDLNKICKIKKRKIIVNKFIFDVPRPKKLKSFFYLKKKYSLKKNFFYLPNQYWHHKNHIVVINALEQIKKNSKKNIIIYSSGSKDDYRFPKNFQNLIKIVKEKNLEKNYIYLGILPFFDVMSLMYHSLAVINPSLFEGWSSTVEQAKSYNKKIILSNIGVHKEQSPQYAYYFEPWNYLKLSKILMKLYSSQNKSFSKKFDTSLKLKINIYAEKFCKNILI